jgi:CDP-diacylglycerol--serine O-phosphatidyltransferase
LNLKGRRRKDGQESPRRRRPALERGLPLLPSLFTSGNLFCGYLSIIFAIEGGFEKAAFFILLAAILDVLDGGLARLTNTESPFGLQFDSLADVVSFGVAPALLAEAWALQNLPRLGWSLSFLFVACAAVRLARFNIQAGVSDRRWFVGLPSPVAAATVAALVFAFPGGPVENPWALAIVGSLVGACAFLMVSRFRYRSLKDVDLRKRRPHQIVLAVAAALVVASLAPRHFVLTGLLVYLASGPFLRLLGALPEAAFREIRLPAPPAGAVPDPLAEDGEEAAPGAAVEEDEPEAAPDREEPPEQEDLR